MNFRLLMNFDLWETIFDDTIGFAVLCVTCVLFLSYLRDKPPEFDKKRIAGAISVLFLGASSARIVAHFASTAVSSTSSYQSIFLQGINHLPEEEVLEVFKNKEFFDSLTFSALTTLLSGSGFDGFEYQKYAIGINVITTFISLGSISVGAFILMKFFQARHIAPMIIIQSLGFLTRQLFNNPYKNFVNKWIFSNFLHQTLEEVRLCGYNGFIYGCFMIIMIIGYILVTRQRYEAFWTKDVHVRPHVWSVIGLVLIYTVLIVAYNCLYGVISANNKTLLLYSFEVLIFIFLAVGLLCVPKRTYSLTRGELQEEFFEVKRKEEVKQYSYSEAQIKAERKYLHDLPGHFRALDSMAKKAGAEEISQYIQELDEKLIQSKGEFSTGNAFLDDFLFSKKKLAQQNNIDIVFNGVFPNEGIKRIDITTIFHNLIENAIEACKKVSEKREIVISSKIHEDRVYLSFSNPFEQKMQQKRGRFETSKKNKAFHGYGMSSVESTVGKKEYDGSFSTRQEGNRFIAEVNLRFK